MISCRNTLRFLSLALCLALTLTLRWSPASADAYEDALSAFTAGDDQATVSIVTDAIASGSLAGSEFYDAVALRGLAHYGLGNHTAAIADLESGLKGASLSAQTSALAWLALIQAETGDFEAARTAIGAAQRNDPSAWDVYARRATINEILGRTDLADEDRQRASTLRANEALPNRGLAREYLRLHSQSLLTTDDWSALAATSAQEDDPFLLALGGYVAALTGSTQQGITLMEHAADQSSGTAYTWDLLGLTRFQIGDPAGAAEAFAAGLAADPQDARALLLLAAARFVEGGDPFALLQAHDEAYPMEPAIAETIAAFPLLSIPAERDRLLAEATDDQVGYDWQLRTFGMVLALLQAGQSEAAEEALHVAMFSRSYSDPFLYGAAVCLRQVYGLP